MSKTVPLRISSDLVNQARTSAGVQDRSPTAQIEHWAKLGRAVEAVLTGASLQQIKEAGRVPSMDELVELTQSPAGQQKAKALIEKHQLPVYEADPESPDRIFERTADGRVRRGRFRNRKFVPDEPDT